MRIVHHFPALIYLLSIAVLGYSVQQSEFGQLFLIYSLAFACYAYFLYKKREAYSFRYLLGMAILARLILLPAFPLLSDDIYRFYWDAWVYDQGYSPFAYLPADLSGMVRTTEMEAVYQSLNSPSYYSVYPPFLQWVFGLAFWMGQSLYGFALSFKALILLSEGLSLWLIYLSLKNLNIHYYALFIYALNPLIIIELSGNAHPEAFLITGLSLLIYGLIKFAPGISFGWGMAIAAKLQPLFLAPLLLFHALLDKRRLLAVVGGTIIGLLTLSALLVHPDQLQNYGYSLQLYYQTFEFNGSIYKVARWLGYQFTGYNPISMIGPLLAILSSTLIMGVSLYYYVKGKSNLISLVFYMAVVWMVYLFFSTTVHPWYLTPILLFSVFVKLESVLLWSYLVILSYVAYSYPEVQEPMWLAYVQYIPVMGMFLLDLRAFLRKNKS